MRFLRRHCPPWFPKGLVAPLALLTALALLVAVAGVIFRAALPYQWQYLLWNMLLAGLPLFFACAALWAQHKKHRLLALPLLLFWLLFYPNAPYMLTDFIHLRHYVFEFDNSVFSTDPAAWFGFMFLCGGSVAGCCCGMLSLILLHRHTARKYGKAIGWLLAAGTTLLSGAGVWIGRCMRFNSWDIWHRPLHLLRSVAEQFDRDSLLLCILFTAMSAGAYLLLRSFLPEESK